MVTQGKATLRFRAASGKKNWHGLPVGRRIGMVCQWEEELAWSATVYNGEFTLDEANMER
ncbi:hypothetical protein BM221_005146 [Beauveria bassiana]|uniref:Uncharacterized protein n=1 Tax=Beauveria bassiana TaxID=176275 RepID=A0A2N6NMV7_BEABA|nr:hypothetical protein BM221_005146 [Beauveria bassiana]